ncbi:hypothetical protein CISG_09499 [Coccidioides immitis RMSCC 3703]|uniref:Uncharacterized protein n=1 Tax=Coccidioides immitis RMSCC 3703 TaxID=454286 RepID=A0A0J8QJ68_COCIT|nr:hypothetical protein CISG_09499 [Coccidioides immitis RMSCC 3703]
MFELGHMVNSDTFAHDIKLSQAELKLLARLYSIYTNVLLGRRKKKEGRPKEEVETKPKRE